VFKIKASTVAEVKLEDVANLLVTAIEGGSNYWYYIVEYNKPEGVDTSPDWNWAGDKDPAPSYIRYAMTEGYSITIADMEENDELDPDDESTWGTTYKLDLKAMEAGLQIMAEKYYRHFKDFIEENYDAETADVFLQCCCFGEAVYG